MITRALKTFVKMLSFPGYILVLVTIAELLVITAGAGCSDDDAGLSISDVSVSEITETTAVISWNTDEPATSTIVYGESSSNLSYTAKDENPVTEHSVMLTGLNPDTTYYYKVRSTDESDNEVISEEPETFSTPPDTNNPVISEIEVSEITESGATIRWVTNEPATGQVEYGTSDKDVQTSDLLMELITNHQVVLTGLETDINYYCRIKSTDGSGNEAVSGDFSLATNPVADITAPLISNISVDNITETTATIYWTTDEPATSDIEYGLNTDYGYSFPSTPDTTADSIYHSLTLSNLSPDTTYHFIVKSADVSDNEAVSDGDSFTTNTITAIDTTPPVISSPYVSIVGSVATITWITDEPATSKVIYLCDT